MKKLLNKILAWIKINPPKYKFVLVFWEDANSDSTWNDLEHIEDMLPTICLSVGFLIKKTDNSFVLASDFTIEEKNDDFIFADGGNTMVIPTKNVLKVVPIPLKIQPK
jgi:hypothetical protein